MKRTVLVAAACASLFGYVIISPLWATVVNAISDFVQISAPSNPTTGNSRVYVDSATHKLACLNSDGSSCAPSGGGGGGLNASGFYLSDGTNYYVPATMGAATLPVAGNFSWVNQGGATETTVGGALVLHGPANSGTQVRMRVSPISTNTKATAATICTYAQANYANCSLVFYESSSGKIESLGINPIAANGGIQINRWNSVTSYAATQFNAPAGSNNGNTAWWQLNISGGNVSYAWSNDGVNFVTLYTEPQNQFFTTAPDKWGYMINEENPSYDIYYTLLSWKVQ
jgi:hypothetical protein